MKRKASSDKGTQPISKFLAAGESRSSFTDCPVCGKPIALATASWHIDECLQRQAPAAQAVQHPPAAPQQGQQAQQQQAQQQQAQQQAQQGQQQEGQQGQQGQQAQPEPERPSGRRPGKEPAEAAQPQLAKPGGALAPPFQRPSKADRIVATGFRPPGSSGKGEEGLTAGALFAASCCELVPAFLPAELAEQLLEQLQRDAPEWEHMAWWIGERGGKPGLSSKTSCHYLLGGAGQASCGGSFGCATALCIASRLWLLPSPSCCLVNRAVCQSCRAARWPAAAAAAAAVQEQQRWTRERARSPAGRRPRCCAWLQGWWRQRSASASGAGGL